MSYLVFKTNSLVLIAFAFATNSSYTFSITTSLFTALLSHLNQQEQVFDLSTFILFTSAFKLAWSDFAARLDVSSHAVF